MRGEGGVQSYTEILENARKSQHGYDPDATRKLLIAAVKSAFNGNEPRMFQLNIAEALILGLDVTAIAGTGSGKTLPWAMPLLLGENKHRTVLVISPLKALQADHVRPSLCATELAQTSHRLHSLIG
jgi:ATP-dependent helicase YprA (DUF1998 family)